MVSIILGCMNQLNRIKEVLREQGRSGKWLSEQLGKDVATVSRWCTNTVQPSIETLNLIAKLLDINVQKLLTKTK